MLRHLIGLWRNDIITIGHIAESVLGWIFPAIQSLKEGPQQPNVMWASAQRGLNGVPITHHGTSPGVSSPHPRPIHILPVYYNHQIHFKKLWFSSTWYCRVTWCWASKDRLAYKHETWINEQFSIVPWLCHHLPSLNLTTWQLWARVLLTQWLGQQVGKAHKHCPQVQPFLSSKEMNGSIHPCERNCAYLLQIFIFYLSPSLWEESKATYCSLFHILEARTHILQGKKGCSGFKESKST